MINRTPPPSSDVLQNLFSGCQLGWTVGIAGLGWEGQLDQKDAESVCSENCKEGLRVRTVWETRQDFPGDRLAGWSNLSMNRGAG
jgi:hypothetical protein